MCFTPLYAHFGSRQEHDRITRVVRLLSRAITLSTPQALPYTMLIIGKKTCEHMQSVFLADLDSHEDIIQQGSIFYKGITGNKCFACLFPRLVV